MPLTPNFSVSQSPGSPEDVTFEDTSTGSDGAITSRRIYVQQSDGDFVVEEGTTTEYELWPLPLGTGITLDLLTQDIGARITVQWLDSGNAVLYDKTLYVGLNGFNRDFDYQLTQNVASNQMLMNDNNFWANKNLLQTFIDSGDDAIERASDINACQQCYNRATNLRLNAQYLFNQNA